MQRWKVTRLLDQSQIEVTRVGIQKRAGKMKGMMKANVGDMEAVEVVAAVEVRMPTKAGDGQGVGEKQIGKVGQRDGRMMVGSRI